MEIDIIAQELLPTEESGLYPIHTCNTIISFDNSCEHLSTNPND